MSDTAPRRLQPRGTVYVDYETGFEVSDAQYRRIEKIMDACDTLYEVMHECEGTTMPGEHQDHSFSSERMKRAGQYVELARYFARKAALEVK